MGHQRAWPRITKTLGNLTYSGRENKIVYIHVRSTRAYMYQVKRRDSSSTSHCVMLSSGWWTITRDFEAWLCSQFSPRLRNALSRSLLLLNQPINESILCADLLWNKPSDCADYSGICLQGYGYAGQRLWVDFDQRGSHQHAKVPSDPSGPLLWSKCGQRDYHVQDVLAAPAA